MKLKFICIIIVFYVFSACTDKKNESIVTPWGEIQTDSTSISDGFTVSDIIAGGELIILTMPGPDTYYDYRGHGMGTQYLLCEKFAQKLGVSLRVELCRDTTEMLTRLDNGEGDIIAFLLPKTSNEEITYCGARVDSLNVQWAVKKGNTELADSLNSWFKPSMYKEIKDETRLAFSPQGVKRHVYAPFLNRNEGIISHYDHLFKKHAAIARWDWKLMAAQCYQESCFDPKARSWAGACGLMQIMPSTAAHLKLPLSDIYDPDKNINAAARYINELSGYFRNIPNPAERQMFVLAAYNGGYFHIQDAMALARKNGKNHKRWKDVAFYVLALETAQYYNDPVVKNGYMRGSETVNYVDRIRRRYAQYRGVPYNGASVPVKSIHGVNAPSSPDFYNPMTPRKAKKKHRFHI